VIAVAALVGATAVGKTALSLELAESLRAEIVSVDSMQIYRGMDVGTAKPSPAERRRVPHHLLDLKDPAEEVTVAEFQRLAREAIEDVTARGRLPLLVGGSGLYLRAVIDDLRFPPRDPAVRARLEITAEEMGVEAMHARLAEVDEEAAARIEPANARRIIRALEVIRLTGRRFSEFGAAWERFESVYDLRIAGLRRSRADLYARIEQRVDEMLANGLVEEARALSARRLARTAAQALGYRQILAAPEGRPEEVRDEIVRATKRFARRQESWFSADPRIRWFDAAAPGMAGEVTSFLSRGGEEGKVP
jgi:tRNA dimethylallyltransferase